MIARSASTPLRSNLVTGRSAQRSTTPAVEPRLGVEHRAASARRSRAQSVASRQTPPGSQPRGGQRGERRRHQPPLVVPLLGPRVGEERPELGQVARAEEVLQAPDRVDREQPHVLGARLGEQPPGCAATPGRHTSSATHVVRRARGRQRRRRLADARPDLHDERRLAAEPRRPAEPGLVDGLVGDHPGTVVGVPGLLLRGGEPAAATRVASAPPASADRPRCRLR